MHSCLRHRPQCGVGVIRACSVQEQRPVRRKRSSQLSKTPTSYTFPFPLPAWERGKRRKQVQAIPQCEDGRLSLFTLVCVSVAQPCLTLCNPMDCSPSGSSVHGILQARILEWIAYAFLQGIFPTYGLNLCILHWQADSLPLSHLGSPQGSLLNPSSACSGVGSRGSTLVAWPAAFTTLAS